MLERIINAFTTITPAMLHDTTCNKVINSYLNSTLDSEI